MYLKSLVLKGFKSFADRSVLSFEPGVSAVVGPNGSGKSNISDAVLWVLGERNAKNLRGQAMEDVIFAGSSARKPVGIAEVDLILDNSDGTLPIDYSEVALTRRMYRNGESEYLINGVIARRMDVLDILHDTGLGTGTHSIISQGSLDSILQSKPEDRRALIEEAAGVLKHKQRKLKSERKLEQMDAHVMRVKDVASEVARQLKPLERKAKRARAYQDFAVQLTELNVVLAVDDLRVLQKKWDEASGHEAGLAAQVEGARNRVERAEATVEQLQGTLQSKSFDAGELAQRYRRAQMALERFEANLLLLREKKHSLQRSDRDLAISLEEGKIKSRAAVVEQEKANEVLVQVCADKARAEAVLRHQTGARDALCAQVKDLSDALGVTRNEQRILRGQIDGALRRQAETKEVLSSNLAHEKLIASHGKELEMQLERALRDCDLARDAAAQIATDSAVLQARDAVVRQTVAAALAAREAARLALDAARDRVANLKAEIQALEELERAQEAANPALAWVMKNKDQFDAEMKPIAHVIKAPDHLEALLEILLGADLSALFVRDVSVASVVAHLLRSAVEVGDIVLLPQRGMRAKRVYPDSLDASVRLVEKLQYPPAYAEAVESLLGDVYLCSDSAAAIACHEKQGADVRFATTDGFVIWQNGKISIGFKEVDDRGALARHRRLESLQSAFAETQKDCEQALGAQEAAEDAQRQAQAESLQVSQKLAEVRGKNDASLQEMKRAEEKLSALRREYEGLEQQRCAAQTALAAARPTAAELEKKLLQYNEDLAFSISQTKKQQRILDPLQAQVLQANEAISAANLEVTRFAERETYAQRLLLAREQEIAALASTYETAQKNLAAKHRVQDGIDPLLSLLETLSSSARRWTDSLEAETTHAQSASAGLHTSINAARDEARGAHQAFDEVNAVLSQARVDKGRLEVQVEAAIDIIVHDCDMPLEKALEMPILKDRAETEDKTFQLRRRIANMGTINPDAAVEYEGLKTRYDYMASQLDDLETARRALSKIVRVIDERMKDDFVRTFEMIDANFREIFSVLFPGGSAHLTLIDPDDPENTGVEVNAQPQGKRISKMMLMSGGEKSLTALALLFAVYRIRSAPFYILDEVEAALDDTNLRRLVAYLDSLREEAQLIMITHQRRTMEMADALFGVSMQADGVTKVVSQKLDRVLKYAKG